tara:strand:+ start:591 stop:1151 length:561 start_codon:yes stop_codon:yes gene_type:complete
MPKKITQELETTIRDEFIHGITNAKGERQYPSLDMLVKRHDVARATLFRRADKEGWQQEKNRIHTEVEQKLDAERLEKMLTQGKVLDDRALTIAQGMLRKVASRMQRGFDDEEQNPKHGGLEVETIRELSQIAINAQRIGKLALGQAQEISKVSADISNPEAFREVMEQLDEIAEARSSRHKHTLQ